MRLTARHAWQQALLGLLLLTVLASRLHAEEPAAWSRPQPPARLWGNTWYVGSAGLSAILITSPQGHVLIDGTTAGNAPMIEANIRALGFRLHDVKLILNSHAHQDHAGALAALARDTGARVLASPAAARALRSGGNDPDDPQYQGRSTFPPLAQVELLRDGQILRLGPLALQAHFTPGHTPGGTSWTWQSCQAGDCRRIAYVDSLNAFTNGAYRYGDRQHPERLARLRRSMQVAEALPCDILLTPHPDASDLLQRLAAHQRGQQPDPLLDPTALTRYVADAKAVLQQQLAAEANSPTH